MTENTDTKLVRTVCPAHCGIDACGILAHVRDGRVVKVEPADFPNPRYRRICLRGLSSLDITYHQDRLKYPMKRVGKRGEGKFERISWDEALDTIANKFKEIAAEYGWPAIGWTLGGPGAGTTKFGAYLRLASLTQSTRVSAWGYGDSGLPCGSRVLFGTHIPYGMLYGSLFRESPPPDAIVVWGSNPAEAQPLNVMRPIMDAKQAGTLLAVVDPRFTVTASKADVYMGVKPGTDTALALAMMNVIFQNNLQADDYIRRHTNGPYLVRLDTGKFLRAKDIGAPEENEYVVWDSISDSPESRNTADCMPRLTGSYTVEGLECKTAFQLLKDLAAEYPPERASEITGVSKDVIRKLAERVGKAETVTFVTNMGFTRTYHGDISFRAMGTLASVTGNVMATFKGGHLPAVLNWKPFLHANPEKSSYARLGILQLYDAVISGKPFPVKAVWFSFVNFLNQCANSGKIKNDMFPKLDFIVAAELFMTPTARYAEIFFQIRHPGDGQNLHSHFLVKINSDGIRCHIELAVFQIKILSAIKCGVQQCLADVLPAHLSFYCQTLDIVSIPWDKREEIRNIVSKSIGKVFECRWTHGLPGIGKRWTCMFLKVFAVKSDFDAHQRTIVCYRGAGGMTEPPFGSLPPVRQTGLHQFQIIVEIILKYFRIGVIDKLPGDLGTFRSGRTDIN